MLVPPRPAPEWDTIRWFNAEEPLSVSSLRGRVIVLYAFQMLCPGCVVHGIPQAKRLAEAFAHAPVSVVGLHTVFEHHDAMTPEALQVFLHEFQIGFPVGVDRPATNGDPIPNTMRAYGMQGTPTTVLIDAAGNLRAQGFGAQDDLVLGAHIGFLLAEAQATPQATKSGEAQSGCDDAGCVPSG